MPTIRWNSLPLKYYLDPGNILAKQQNNHDNLKTLKLYPQLEYYFLFPTIQFKQQQRIESNQTLEKIESKYTDKTITNKMKYLASLLLLYKPLGFKKYK